MGRQGHKGREASIHAALDDFVTKLMRKRLGGSSLALARHTTEVLIHAVAAQQAPTAEGIIEGVRAVSKKLVEARPLELVVGNMCRRVLHIIREEAAGDGGKASNPASDANDASDGSDDEDNSFRGGAMKAFKAEVIEVIGELIDELESVNAHIVQQALEHVSPSSVVLTSGGSDIVEAFLREANRKRKFQCIVAEGAPALTGHQMARALAERGVETTAVADASVFAMMSRANLVVLSACGVFANGGILAPAGHHTVALAAKSHSVPVVFLAGLHELSPLGPGDDAFDANDLLSPADVIDYTALADCGIGRGATAGNGGGGGPANEGATPDGDVAALSVANPAYDYVPPELVTLVLTDVGGAVPAFVKQLLGEIYDPADRTF
mmetsp:Transcript_11893/g.46057  ORF Transcript_11893/g.46057 Transcript_11893/m.46057 type:complete len:382 (-) Transcript_11893:113-1258(-)